METRGCSIRWELSFSLIDSKTTSKQLLFDSPPLPMDVNKPDHTFDWPSLSLAIPEMSILKRDAFIVAMNLIPIDTTTGNRGRILWFPCIVQYTSMMFHQSRQTLNKPFTLTFDYNLNTCLSMVYSGNVLHDDYGRSARFYLHQLTLTVKNNDLAELVHKQEQQALVCVAEIMWRDTNHNMMMKSPLIYLNRAGAIQSRKLGKDRMYVWHLTQRQQDETFPGLKRKSERDWHKQLQEHKDMVKLGLVTPLSTMRGGNADSLRESALPDHEATSLNKTTTYPPLLVGPGQTVILRFFNLASSIPKQGCEVHIKWNDYICAGMAPPTSAAIHTPQLLRKSGFKRFSLNALYKRAKEEKTVAVLRSSFIVYSGFTVEIDYSHVTVEQIAISAIYVHVQDYHYTLDKLGHYHILNSV